MFTMSWRGPDFRLSLFPKRDEQGNRRWAPYPVLLVVADYGLLSGTIPFVSTKYGSDTASSPFFLRRLAWR